MNKIVWALTMSALLSMSAGAAEPTTINGRMDRIEEVVCGSVQNGALVDRIDAADAIVYGKGNKTAEGLNERVGNLYADVVNSGSDAQPSISARINALEYYLNDEIRKESLETRLDDLENAVLGKSKTGALDERALALEEKIYGDKHPEMREVVLPAKTVFKVSLNESVSSKSSQVGDAVTFTVEEDVKVGNVIVLPRGSQGQGIVTKVEKPKSFGRSGNLDISFDQVFSLDDEVIPTVLGPEARDKLKWEAAAVGASAVGALALGPIGLVGGYFVKGSDVELSAGTKLYIETKNDATIKGLIMESGAPNIVLRQRVEKKISSNKKISGNKKSSDMKNELKFVNESGEVIDVSHETDKVKKDVSEKTDKVKEDVSEKADTVKSDTEEKVDKVKEIDTEKADKAGDDSASVVIVRNA